MFFLKGIGLLREADGPLGIPTRGPFEIVRLLIVLNEPLRRQ